MKKLIVFVAAALAIALVWQVAAITHSAAETEKSAPVPEPIIIPTEALAPVSIAEPPLKMETPTPEPQRVERYAAIIITEDELWELAAIIYLEARNQSAEGQQAVAEVVLNRVIADNFPSSVHEVLFQGAGTKRKQFTPIDRLHTAEPTQEQYDVITAALYGPSILPDDVVYFSRSGENNRVWGRIEDHVFCYQYIWE